MWPEVMNNSSAFASVPLWDTDARDVQPATWTADVNVPRPIVYGGWNSPSTPRVMVQQAFEISLGGVAVDLNSVRADFLK